MPCFVPVVVNVPGMGHSCLLHSASSDGRDLHTDSQFRARWVLLPVTDKGHLMVDDRGTSGWCDMKSFGDLSHFGFLLPVFELAYGLQKTSNNQSAGFRQFAGRKMMLLC